ncbi:unnamed protein product [Phytophthora lilii]|uniref:Unnamed protein product n=1 Tax=Phytophthora lilii TaxID=2077276 RepID=A0A9W6U2P9_9STRA|nr:unnamed protein product [Phytophthora lilii]
MKMLRLSHGPLTGSSLSHLKSEIRKDPELLGTDVVPYDELCTLLHQASAGPAHDAELVEWMIQMGALFTQPLHCRSEPRQRNLACPRKLLPSTMAVHSAAIAGYTSIVRVLFEADNLVDLSTQIYHMKETLAHLAVRRYVGSTFNLQNHRMNGHRSALG